jgi:hypothetical protein
MMESKNLKPRGRERERARGEGGAYELVGGGDDEVQHVADPVGLEDAVPRVGGLPLQLAYGEPLQPLQVLVRRPRRLQHRRRHRRERARLRPSSATSLASRRRPREAGRGRGEWS